MSCGCCGKCGCQCGSLPFSMTVAFSGLTNKTHGQYCELAFSADFGSGAEGVATAPGGCDGDSDAVCGRPLVPPPPGSPPGSPCVPPEPPYDPSDRGPLSGVMLTATGSCYARLGRVEPTLKASAEGGSGASFDIYAVMVEGEDGFHYWEVKDISVSGGKGYVDQSPVRVSWSVGDTRVVDAVAKLNADAEGVPVSVTITTKGKYYRESKDAAPYVAEVTVTPCGGGSGAEITATVNDDPYDEKFGQIESLAVAKGGEGYLAWQWREVCHARMNKSFVLRAKTPIELVSIEPIEACYGSGACARVVPLGDREAPEVCVYGSGTGGSITVSLQQFFADPDDNPWKPQWKISSVSASGGENYIDGESALILYGGATVASAAQITLAATPIAGDPPAGGVLTGATLVTPGAFYIQHEYDGSPGPLREIQLLNKGSGYAKLGRIAPTLKAEPPALPAGTGNKPTLVPTLASKKDDCGVDYWYVQSVAVSDPGSGFTTGGLVTFSVDGPGEAESPASASIVANEDEDEGPLGAILSVDVSEGGKYFREDEGIAAYATPVTVGVTQLPPSNGSGAEFDVVVETDPKKAEFGQIKKIKVKPGGSGYSLWGGPSDCTYCGPCGIELRFRGVNKEPEVTYDDAVFRAEDPLVDCNTPPSTATVLHSIGGGSVAISRGGTYTTDQACPCEPAQDCPCSDTNCPGGGTPVPNPPGCATNPGDETDKCPPCRGTCNGCNPCGTGCVCIDGNCAPCEGTCSSAADCDSPCECIDGNCSPPVPVPCCVPVTYILCCSELEDGTRFGNEYSYVTDEEKAAAEAACEAASGVIDKTYVKYECRAMVGSECEEYGGEVLEDCPGENSMCINLDSECENYGAFYADPWPTMEQAETAVQLMKDFLATAVDENGNPACTGEIKGFATVSFGSYMTSDCEWDMNFYTSFVWCCNDEGEENPLP